MGEHNQAAIEIENQLKVETFINDAPKRNEALVLLGYAYSSMGLKQKMVEVNKSILNQLRAMRKI